MAITTLDQAISGLQVPYPIFKTGSGQNAVGAFATFWAGSAQPPAGAYDTTLNGVTLTSSVTGVIPWTDPDGTNDAYVGRLEAMPTRSDLASGINVCPLLCDRLWHNGGITITSTAAQAIVSPTWPARDVDGATAGRGIFLALEVSAVPGAATPTITIEYTNSGGIGGRIGTNIFATVSASVAGTVYLISLEAGDVGVQSVESITLSTSWISGTINLVAFRPILYMLETRPLFANVCDAFTAGLPLLHAGSALYFMGQSRSTSGFAGIAGAFQVTWG